MPERTTRAQLAALASTLGRARVLQLVAVALAWALLPVASLAISHVVLGVPTRGGLVVVAMITSAIAVALPWLRGARTRVTPIDAALWAERLEPRLQYTLVTIADADAAVAARLEPVVRAVPWMAAVQPRARARLLRAAALFVASVAAFVVALMPWRPHPEAAAVILRGAVRPAAAGARAPGALAIAARLVPPAYTGAASRPIPLDGSVHEAIEGTLLVLSAPGEAARVAITVREAGDTTAGGRVALDADGTGWRATVRVGTAPVAVRVADGVADRWVTIAARPDSIPEVALEVPAADIVTRDTLAAIPIRGTARDDIGLREARVEYILTTGGGEQFAAKTGVLGVRTGALGPSVAVGATLSLGALGVKPGDVLHVRVVARDGNTVRG
ncbi:MAG: DUF4175 domain-containing protein, partial [Gemmatimonadaceae bacterium]|nr:DUF4175 domain-containing protein [Gemmatimonadaceae bacterium]MCU0627195.1 DUF4175 domain-containing protein [Gemmatimonadaceae bacterium]